MNLGKKFNSKKLVEKTCSKKNLFFNEVITTGAKSELFLKQLFRLFIGALRQMLNLNQPESKSIAPEPVWKILIYDRYGQDIISPLLSVKELREMGVTLHV